MTDRFEDAVRDAFQGLPSASQEMPTYHGAWERGRRRRFVKRSVVAAAGALVFVAALTVNLGRIPGSNTTEVDDVATSLEAATPVFEPTPLATTSPIDTPDSAAASSAAPSLEIPAATADEPTPEPTATPSNDPAVTTAPAQQAAPTATAVPPQPTPTPPAPNPTAVPTTPPAPVAPTPVPTTGADQPAQADTTNDPADPGSALGLPTENDPNNAAGTAEQPPDPGSPDEQQPLPEPEFTGAAAEADAVILGGAARGVAIPCDLDRDGLADANCELLVDYACSGDGDVRPGYTAIDIDGDQINDTCIAIDVTRCDTTQDGIGDTPCIIELTETPIEQSGADG